MEKIQMKDLKLVIPDGERDLIEYNDYLVKKICSIFGVPECYFVPVQKENLWQKIRRNVRLLIFKLGLVKTNGNRFSK